MGRCAEISVAKAASLMHKDAEYVRLGLRQKQLDFGSAVQKPNGRWSYNIVPKKFFEYLGEEITNEEIS